MRVSQGTSNAEDTHSFFDYGDYTQVVFQFHLFYPAWSDNSDSTGSIAAAPAMASTSVPVTIHSAVIVGPFTGTWSASGGINDSGTLVEPTVNFVGNGELHIVRDVTGSRGTFTLRIDSKVVVITGTGAYTDLHGQGTRSAVATNGVVTETLTGSVHHD